MLKLKNVIKYYGTKCALNDVSLSIPRGEIVGLFGENGAGKTTLMKSVLNLLAFDGEVTLDGEPITRKNIAKLSFATCEHSYYPNLSAESHKVFYQEQFPNFLEKRFRALMEFFELPRNKVIKSFSTGLSHCSRTMSMEVGVLTTCTTALPLKPPEDAVIFASPTPPAVNTLPETVPPLADHVTSPGRAAAM